MKEAAWRDTGGPDAVDVPRAVPRRVVLLVVRDVSAVTKQCPVRRDHEQVDSVEPLPNVAESNALDIGIGDTLDATHGAGRRLLDALASLGQVTLHVNKHERVRIPRHDIDDAEVALLSTLDDGDAYSLEIGSRGVLGASPERQLLSHCCSPPPA